MGSVKEDEEDEETMRGKRERRYRKGIWNAIMRGIRSREKREMEGSIGVYVEVVVIDSEFQYVR